MYDFIIIFRFVILLHISVKDGGGILASWQGKYMCAIQSISLKSSLAFIVSKGLFVLLHRETFLFFVAIQNPLYIYCEGKYNVVQQQCRHICGHAASLPSHYFCSCIDAKDISSFNNYVHILGCLFSIKCILIHLSTKLSTLSSFVRRDKRLCYCQEDAINH